jgi:hypothetical protein
MDKEAATILADAIKELKSAIMFWGIAYKEHSTFMQNYMTQMPEQNDENQDS